MTTKSDQRTCATAWWLLLWAVFLLPASAAASYVIYFKDGSNMFTRSPYIIQGERVLVTLPGGTETTFALSEIDQEKTRRQNLGNLSDVVVIDASGTRAFNLGESSQTAPRTLQDRIREGKGRTRDLTAEATHPEESAASRAPQTLAGYTDLERALREPLTDTTSEADINASLRAMGLARFRLYQGTQPQRLMVEITTAGRFEVFQQLEALAKGFALATEGSPYTALEVLMLNDRRSRAGQFLLSQENMPLLAKKILTPQQFFLQYVQF